MASKGLVPHFKYQKLLVIIFVWWEKKNNCSRICAVDGSEILHPLGMYATLANNGVNYLSTGAGFLPSTV